jgi:hypothetical protein
MLTRYVHLVWLSPVGSVHEGRDLATDPHARGRLGLAQITEVLKDRRASDRERKDRQAELQRATLLALQGGLLELYDIANAADLAIFVAMLQQREGSTKRTAEAEEEAKKAKQRFRDAEAKARLLISRVQDDQAPAVGHLISPCRRYGACQRDPQPVGPLARPTRAMLGSQPSELALLGQRRGQRSALFYLRLP